MFTFVYFLIGLFILFLSGTFFMFFKFLNNNRNMENKLKTFCIITVICAISLFSCYFISESSYYFKEVLNYKVSSVKHQERWSEKVIYTVQVASGRDSKGNTTYRTETRTRTDYHGPFWYAMLENGKELSISESEYNHWRSVWNNEKHVSTKIGTAKWCDNKVDGKCFESYWTNEFKDIYPYPIISRYKNKIRKSNSVFKYSSNYENFGKHPVEQNNSDAIICFGTNVSNNDIELLNKVNAYLGYRKEIHIITILIANRDINIVNDIISSWQGLNKNELAVFIGVDNDKNIKWCYVQSWLDNTKLHGIIEDEIILSKKINIEKIKDIYMNNINNNWNRKQFKDFDYIRQSTELRYYVIGFIVFAIFSIIQMVACYILKTMNPNYYSVTENKKFAKTNSIKKIKKVKIKDNVPENKYVKIRKW